MARAPKNEDLSNMEIVEAHDTYEDYLDSQLTEVEKDSLQ
jgi:hypothetical protein